MTIEIKTTYFVKPRAAFQIVGRESFGDSWRPEAVDEVESELRYAALSNLRAALQSGYVRAIWHDFVKEGWLDPRDAAGEFFNINLRDDCIHLHDGAPVQCGIHSEDLLRFIQAEGKRSKLTIGDETGCREWLAARFAEGEAVPTRAVLWAQAKAEYPKLSKAGFDRARAHAARALGRELLRSAGRPRTVEN
jgi:hypothetical protein